MPPKLTTPEEKAISLYNQSYSLTTVAKKLRMSRGRVTRIMRRNDIYIRNLAGGDAKARGSDARIRTLEIRPRHVTSSPEWEKEKWLAQQQTAFVAAMRKAHPELVAT